MTKRRKKKAPSPAVAVLLDRRTWREFRAVCAELTAAAHAARDLALQLREILIVKQRHALAGQRAADTRKANAAADADDGVDLSKPMPTLPPEVNGPAPRPPGGE